MNVINATTSQSTDYQQLQAIKSYKLGINVPCLVAESDDGLAPLHVG